ncbi:MAG: hypothetical protein ACQESR_10730 [Planctomycetota bacterium]
MKRIMSTYLRSSTYGTFTPIFLFGAILAATFGCGDSERASVVDARSLLERYQEDRRRHDPLHFSEVEIGKFAVTQRREPAIFYIRFHLFGVVPDDRLDRFKSRMETYGERVRAEVRTTTQKCELKKLNDPSLKWLKSELISSINRVVGDPMLRDVVFSEFSLERT